MAATQSIIPADVHSTSLAAHFGGNVTYGGQAPLFDTPLYILGFTNRSGSNLLGEYLSGHPRLHGFNEVLNHPQVAQISTTWDIRSFPDYIAALAGPPAKKGKAFGVKASPAQLMMLLRWRIDRMFTGLRLIHISRDDLLDQAVSMVIAQSTRQWDSTITRPPAATPAYDFGQIHRVMQVFTHANLQFRVLAETFGLPCIRVTYEDLTTDPAATVGRIIDWAGLDRRGWDLPAPTIAKQASDLSRDFRQRYLDDYRAMVLK